MKKFLTEFKEFAVRGNVIDMAVGIVIGGAFSKIVTCLLYTSRQPAHRPQRCGLRPALL